MNFNKLVNDNELLIWKVVNRYNIDYLDKDDLYQECLMKIYDSMDCYNNEYKMSTYLYSILSNHLSNIVKENNTQKRKNHLINSQGIDIILGTIKDYDFNEYISDNEYTELELYVMDIAQYVLNTLNDKKRYIANEYLFTNRTQQDIGNELGLSRMYISLVWNEFIDKVKEILNNEMC